MPRIGLLVGVPELLVRGRCGVLLEPSVQGRYLSRNEPAGDPDADAVAWNDDANADANGYANAVWNGYNTNPNGAGRAHRYTDALRDSHRLARNKCAACICS